MGKVRWREVEQDNTLVVEEIREIVFHRIRMGDCEDPDLMVAAPIYDWQQTEQGKFVMNNSADQPRWERVVDPMTYGWSYYIIAEMETKKLAEYYLKWGQPNVRNN